MSSQAAPEALPAPPARVSPRAVAAAAERLAVPSSVVDGILQLLDDGAASPWRLAAGIAGSPEVAAHVVREAGSVPGAGPVDSLERAVDRLGEDGLRGVLLTAPTCRLLDGPLSVYGISRLAVLRHSREVAATARSLARRRSAALGPRAYLAGLLHDLGKPILSAVAPGRPAAPGSAPDVPGEQRVLGTDHARVGGWIARRWGLPAEIGAAVESHHARRAPESVVARSVWLADIAVHAAHGDADAEARLAAAGAACGLSRADVEDVLAAAPDGESPGRAPGLTARESQILRLLASGGTAKQVAHRLGCAPSTVHNHLHHVYRKLEVSGQAQALLLARERGWA